MMLSIIMIFFCIFDFLQNIDEELTLATQAFLEGEECTVDVPKREVRFVIFIYM